jgi:hypothetical protein
MGMQTMRFGLGAIAVLALTAVPAFATDGTMNVATFLAKADALRAKGPFALMSSDYKLLRAEGTAAGESYRARLRQERAAGSPSSCPPQGVSVNSNELISHLRTYPAAARPTTTMRTAIADFFVRKWPCPR